MGKVLDNIVTSPKFYGRFCETLPFSSILSADTVRWTKNWFDIYVIYYSPTVSTVVRYTAGLGCVKIFNHHLITPVPLYMLYFAQFIRPRSSADDPIGMGMRHISGCCVSAVTTVAEPVNLRKHASWTCFLLPCKPGCTSKYPPAVTQHHMNRWLMWPALVIRLRYNHRIEHTRPTGTKGRLPSSSCHRRETF